jgi:hypothetical protein
MIKHKTGIKTQEVFEVLWKLTRSVNVIALTENESGNEYEIHRWHPYSELRCDGVMKRLTNLTISDWSPHKVNRNLRQCPLFIASLNIMPYTSGDEQARGFEDQIIKELVEYFNMTVTRIKPPLGYRFYLH